MKTGIKTELDDKYVWLESPEKMDKVEIAHVRFVNLIKKELKYEMLMDVLYDSARMYHLDDSLAFGGTKVDMLMRYLDQDRYELTYEKMKALENAKEDKDGND